MNTLLEAMSGWPAQIADRLCVYQLPEREYREYRQRVNMWHVKRFVDQFPKPIHDAAWAMLEKFQLLDLYLLTSEWKSLPEEPKPIAVPLTARHGESAQLMSYFISKRSVDVVSVEEAAGWRGPVWFFDDFLMSGKQARTSVQLMLGLEPDLPKERVSNPLSAGAVQWFRNANITFRFACGTNDGRRSLCAVLKEAGVNARVEIMHEARRLDAQTIGRTEQQCQELCEFLREVGYSLNQTNRSAIRDPQKWNADLCQQHALGYGGMRLITASFYGVPAATITAVWKHGTYQGKEWMPLLPRLAI